MSKFIGSIIVYIKNNNLFQLKFIFPSTNESHNHHLHLYTQIALTAQFRKHVQLKCNIGTG